MCAWSPGALPSRSRGRPGTPRALLLAMASIRRWGAFALFTVVGCGGAAFSTGSPDASGDDGGHLPDASDGATDAGACVTATVTFELRAASGKSFCVGGNALACATDWLSV